MPVRRTVFAMSRRLLLLVLPLIGAAALWFLVGRGEQPSAGSWTACEESQLTCIRSALELELGNVDPVTATAKARSVFEEDPTRKPGCHAVMHEIGQILAERGETPEMGATWAACGYGVLHGVYETLPLPKDPEEAGRVAYRACSSNTEVTGNRDLSSRCEHALGHSLWRNFDGDLKKAVAGCLQSSERQIFENCLSGVYMMDKNENWTTRPTPTDAAQWREAFAGCEDRVQVACVLAHAETAAFHSTPSARGWFEVCLDVAQKDGRGVDLIGGRCAYLLAQSQTFEEQRKNPPASRLSDCVAWTEELLPAVSESCREGALNALAALGVKEDERQGRLCASLSGTRLSC